MVAILKHMVVYKKQNDYAETVFGIAMSVVWGPIKFIVHSFIYVVGIISW